MEGAVKDIALIGQKEPWEIRQNDAAIIKSHIVEETNMLARQNHVHEIDGTLDHVSSGSKLISHFLDVVEEQFNQNISKEKIKRAQQLLSRMSQF